MRNQYPYIGNPLGFELRKERPVMYPKIKCWEQFSEEDKKIMQSIKKMVEEQLGSCAMYLYGSRVKGNWEESSDYDIIIEKKLPLESILKIEKLNYPLKKDFKYYEKVKEFVKEAVLIK